MHSKEPNHLRNKKSGTSDLSELKIAIDNFRKQVEQNTNRTINELKPLQNHISKIDDVSRKVDFTTNEIKHLSKNIVNGKLQTKMWGFRLQVIGGIFLFFAWGVQNYLQKNNQSMLSRHDYIMDANRSQALHADITELYGRLFDYLYYRDTIITLKGAAIDGYQNYCLSVANQDGNAYQAEYDDKGKLSESEFNGSIDSVNLSKDSVNHLSQRLSLDSLRELFYTTHEFSGSILKDYAARLYNLRQGIQNKIKTENIIFLVVYFFGSLLLGLGFYINNRQKFKMFFRKSISK